MKPAIVTTPAAEEWRPVKGYEGLYEVSNLGRVRSLDRKRPMPLHNKDAEIKGRIIRQSPASGGYMCVTLCDGHNRKTKSVHRLVAFAFVSGYFPCAQVNHIDENKANNRASNLELVTCSQNNYHGTHPIRIAKSKYKEIEQLSSDGVIISTYQSITAACKATGAHPSAISRALRSSIKAKGFLWRLAH